MTYLFGERFVNFTFAPYIPTAKAGGFTARLISHLPPGKRNRTPQELQLLGGSYKCLQLDQSSHLATVILA